MTAPVSRLRQQRDLDRIIRDAINLYRDNAGPFLSIAAVVIPLGIAAAALQARFDDPVAESLVLLPVNLLQVAVNLLVAAALIAALGRIDSGQPAEFSHAYDVAFERFWTLAGAVLRVVFHVLLFAITIVGIPWAIQRLVRWVFAEQAVILDGRTAEEALSHSAAAVSGYWWRTLGISIVVALLAGIPFIISVPFSLAPVLISGTVSAILTAGVLPFSITAMTLLYFDLKLRHEPVAQEASP